MPLSSGNISQEKILQICRSDYSFCQPLHFCGPTARDFYLIHFVASGKGILKCEGYTYHLGPKQGFIIFPGEEAFYQASEDDPWLYSWVGYKGLQAEKITRSSGLTAINRIFTIDKPFSLWQTMMQMSRDIRDLRYGQMAAVGGLLRVMSLIAQAVQPPEAIDMRQEYCSKALWYLRGNFDRDISIQEVADFVGISRSHLYRMMMETYNCSPKEMLLQIRMEYARQLLEETNLKQEEIARRAGLHTSTQLGVSFRAAYGLTPGQFRQQQRKE